MHTESKSQVATKTCYAASCFAIPRKFYTPGTIEDQVGNVDYEVCTKVMLRKNTLVIVQL